MGDSEFERKPNYLQNKTKLSIIVIIYFQSKTTMNFESSCRYYGSSIFNFSSVLPPYLILFFSYIQIFIPNFAFLTVKSLSVTILVSCC